MTVDKKKLPKGITQRSNGLYMGRFQYEGERYTLYDEDIEKLQNKIDDMKYELRHGIYEKEQNITVNGWFDTWMKEYKENSVKRGTLNLYQDVYKQYIKKELGKKKIKDVRPEQIQRIFNTMAKQYKSSRIRSVNGVLSGMFKQAYKNQIINKNPMPLTTLPKKEPKKPARVMTLEEQQLFLQYAKEEPLYDLMEIALFTGMRNGELRGLEWSDIDFKNRVIHVTGTLVDLKAECYKDTPKTPTSNRDIPMLDNVYQLLRGRKKRQAEMRLMLGEHWRALPHFQNLVFTMEHGGYLHRQYINVHIEMVVEQIRAEGIEFQHITSHTLRHTFATRCIEKGMPPQVLKTILGHSTLAMTMDLYSHVLPDTKSEEMQKIANLF